MIEKSLFDIPFLASRWDDEFQIFKTSGASHALLNRLRNWVAGGHLKESSSEGSFIKQFFCETWGYAQEGDNPDGAFQSYPQFPVDEAGQRGGVGWADLALGYFCKSDDGDQIPQVLCEFKDIWSALDKRQYRKGNSRSPVEQCFDYLRGSRTRLSGTELVVPYWAIVTDMNEFRLYSPKFGRSQFQRFVIEQRTGDEEEPLLADTNSAEFLRFLFWKLFQKSSLLSQRGPSYLQQLLEDQLVHEQALEKDFYLEYKAYREFLYRTIREFNPAFQGTPGELVRLTQRFLDRCLFILFCEDMGDSLQFPGDLLRTLLIQHSQDQYYSPDDTILWERLKYLFTVMRDGGTFGDLLINRFNGGLFEPLPELEELLIPTKVFCSRNQGISLSHPLTLLFFSVKYNFGIKDAGHERMIDFYSLGRIFEQSITELEIMEAEVEGRSSLNLLSKRKRNGVYYTPEWVTSYIVRETVGARLADIKERLELTPERTPTQEDIDKYRLFLQDKRYTAPVAGAWLASLEDYRLHLQRLRIVDPACGSGAFLIQALEYLKNEYRWLYNELERIRGYSELWETDVIMKSILSHNLYGVDINPESVEITKLALWMYTAQPGKPLSHLDHNIRCGNSLVGLDFADFYQRKHASLFTDIDLTKQERVNAFDWQTAFPKVFERGGFDCVIGNPPYVKLQNFRRVEEDVAEYLVQAKNNDDKPVYCSTQSGSFDLYLPFIEKGISLLRAEGRMGYIAPNVWMVNKYGASLRSLLQDNPVLDRWIDFKSFQVFEEAITYTALQFFKKGSCHAIRCYFAPDGDISAVDWEHPPGVVPYSELKDDDAWNLLPDSEGKLIQKLNQRCTRLDHIGRIIVGIQTSADPIYHLERIGSGKYRTKGGEIVPVEDDLMRPLVSGPDAKRYLVPNPKTYLLFPYDISGDSPWLYRPEEMANLFPNGWEYLLSNEVTLRAREKNKFDDNQWYRFGRNQNIDKQELTKLCVAQTVPRMRVCFDYLGEYYINNVRVNGIITDCIPKGWFLLGILNSSVVDFVFRRIAKSKEGGYYEANKQFIAPLPIPDASEEQMDDIGERARLLQELHTRRFELVQKVSQRLKCSQMVDDKRDPTWLWADIWSIKDWKQSPDAPADLQGRRLTKWAKERMQETLAQRLEEMNLRLHPRAILTIEDEDDEIRLLIDGFIVIELLGQPDVPFIAAQWHQTLRDVTITDKYTARRLLSQLLSLRASKDASLVASVVALDLEIRELDMCIAGDERDLNLIIFNLYGLSRDEIGLVERSVL